MLGKAHASLGILAGTTSVVLAGPYFLDTLESPFVAMPVTSIAAVIIGGGMGLLPDMDTRGTLVRSMGILGIVLNKIAISLSAVAWHTTATKYDTRGKYGGYHRLLTHCIPFALLLTLGIFASTNIPGIGEYVGMTYVGICLTAVFALMYSPVYKKYRSAFGPTLLLLAGVAVTAAVMFYGKSVDPTLGNRLLVSIMFSGAALLGILSHIVLGDGITEEGTPMLAPIKIKGKRWYRLHLFGLRFKADSPVVNRVVEAVSGALTIAIIGISLYLGFTEQPWSTVWTTLSQWVTSAWSAIIAQIQA